MKPAAIYAHHPKRSSWRCARSPSAPGGRSRASTSNMASASAKGRDERPELDRLLKDAVRRQLDIVMTWSVDCLGCSLRDPRGLLGDLYAQSVDQYLPAHSGHRPYDARR